MGMAALLLIVVARAMPDPTEAAICAALQSIGRIKDTDSEHGCATSGCRHDVRHVPVASVIWAASHRAEEGLKQLSAEAQAI